MTNAKPISLSCEVTRETHVFTCVRVRADGGDLSLDYRFESAGHGNRAREFVRAVTFTGTASEALRRLDDARDNNRGGLAHGELSFAVELLRLESGL